MRFEERAHLNSYWLLSRTDELFSRIGLIPQWRVPLLLLLLREIPQAAF